MHRRIFLMLLVASLLMGWGTAPVQARGSGSHARGPTGTFKGVIAAVAGNTIRLNVGKETEKIVIFWTDDKTSITGGGKRGTLADLEPGQRVTVKARNGHANSVEVEVKGEGSGKDNKRGNKKDGEKSDPDRERKKGTNGKRG